MNTIQQNDSGCRAFTVGSAAVAGRRVVVLDTDGTIRHAAATDTEFLGVTGMDGAAAGGTCNVFLRNKPGTLILTAGGAVGAGDTVMPAAAGKVVEATTGTKSKWFRVLTEAGADGDEVEAVAIVAQPVTAAG